MRNLRLVLVQGLTAALIIGCSGGQAVASQAAPTASTAAAGKDGRAQGTAHYEASGDLTASGDLNLTLSYVDGSNPGTASLEFQGAATTSADGPDDLVIRVHPNSNSIVLKTSTIQVSAGKECKWDLGVLSPDNGTGTIQCDRAAANGPTDPSGSKSVALKITFTYHK
jgi:hypothetical protein